MKLRKILGSPFNLVTHVLHRIETKQNLTEVGQKEGRQRLVFMGFDKQRPEAIVLGNRSDPIQEDGFPDTPKPHEDHALRRASGLQSMPPAMRLL